MQNLHIPRIYPLLLSTVSILETVGFQLTFWYSHILRQPRDIQVCSKMELTKQWFISKLFLHLHAFSVQRYEKKCTFANLHEEKWQFIAFFSQPLTLPDYNEPLPRFHRVNPRQYTRVYRGHHLSLSFVTSLRSVLVVLAASLFFFVTLLTLCVQVAVNQHARKGQFSWKGQKGQYWFRFTTVAIFLERSLLTCRYIDGYGCVRVFWFV